jgi:YD repeat-containing protein
MEMSPLHLAGQKREPQDRLAGVSPQSVYMAGKCGQGMVKICREAAYLNNGMQRTRFQWEAHSRRSVRAADAGR